jgi:hypothetical protein
MVVGMLSNWTFCTETPNKIEKTEQPVRRNYKSKESSSYVFKGSVRKWSNVSAEKIQKSSKMHKAEAVRAVEIPQSTASILTKEAKESFEISLALSMNIIHHSKPKIARKRITIQDLIN